MDRMTVSEIRQTPFVTSIACATDFSDTGTTAFLHALALAAAEGGGTRLSILNASDDRSDFIPWDRFPGVRETLIAWGRLDSGAPRHAVEEAINVAVDKVALVDGDPVRLLARHLAEHPVDLLVLGTEGRTGFPRWFAPSFAETLARRTPAMTLFVPDGAKGFVDAGTGRISLRRVLVPVDRDPMPQVAIEQAIRISGLVEHPAVELSVLHVGPPDGMPGLDLPECFDFSWYAESRDGPVAATIKAVAQEAPTDLIIMPTAGQQGVVDALRGSVTEQVLRGAPCPVLAIPAL
ncbi:MAG: universal stress protein [Pseudomonadota bacterium]